MKERFNYELPHPRGYRLDDGTREYRPDYLEDYVTLYWYSDIIGDVVECEVNPDRVLDFMIHQEEIEGEIDWL